MSNLTDFFGKGAERVPGKAAHAQAAFVVVASDSTSYMNYILYDHALRSMGTVSYLHASSTEFGATSGAWNYSTAPATNSTQTNTHGIAKNGYIGSPLGYGSPENFRGNNPVRSGGPAREVHHSYQNLPGAMNGTNPGLKQDYALGTSDHNGVGPVAWIRSCQRSSRSVIKGHNNILDSGQSAELIHDTVYPQAVGMLTSGYRLAVGGFSYNQNSGNAIIIERDNSSSTTQWRPVLIKNFPDPRKYVSDQKAWGAAITGITAVSANRVVGGLNNNVSNRDYHDYAKPILCDNNDVIMMTSRSSGVDVHRWRWNSGNNTWDAATQTYKTYSTKYHASGTAAFPNWCMSLDGKTAILMSHTYYYGCGYALAMIDVATGNARMYSGSSSSQSFSIVPIGASKFLLSSSTNSDGSGLYASTISWAEGAVDNAYDSFTFGNEMTTFVRYAIDNSYSSTSYPTITPIITVDNESIVLAEKGEL
jgi:hypothetical protein